MAVWIVAAIGAAGVWALWRAMRPAAPPPDGLVDAVGGVGGAAARPPQEGLHGWPRLGRFDFEVAATHRAHHQAALQRALERHGAVCVATLVPLGTARDSGAPVEVHVGEWRVGFLSDADATRFRHRLAYEGHAGEASQCGACIVCTDEARRGAGHACTILLDLKPFRH